MSELLEFDPLTGVSRYFDFDEETKVVTLTSKQDVSGLLEHTKALRNANATDSGIKRGMWHYASIPPMLEMQMRSAGIDLYDPGSTKRIIQWINEHAPAFKVTTKNDSGKAAKLFAVSNGTE